MPKLKIDDQEIEVPAGITILQACELAGKEIPRFCYHERLSIAGNCRMCLVEQEKAPKPVASCAMPVAEGMVIKTDSPMVRKARKGVMEFLLINHPLDCPICDQGGECDLQDQAMAYGFDRSRFEENKRAVPDKNLGPIVKTSMNRCIHCTRCIRFSTEVAGVEVMGATHRGEQVEVTTYLEQAIDSELSGNLVDLCPVGALTSKPYAFIARPWELARTESVDVLDGVGSNIRVDSRGREVLRILPRLHEEVNEEWLADKSRHACDGLHRQRLDRPYVRKADGKLHPVSWEEAFATIAARIKNVPGNEMAAIAGDLCDAESMLALKDLMQELGSVHLECRQDGSLLDYNAPVSYLFNTGIAGMEASDACLLIGTNPRWEAPLVNTRLRKNFLKGNFKIGLVGEQVDLTYAYDYLGAGPDSLAQIAEGTHPFAQVLKHAKAPMLILGSGALRRKDAKAVLHLARTIAENSKMVREDWNGFNFLARSAALTGALELGFHPGERGLPLQGMFDAIQAGAMQIVYLLGADELDMKQLGKAFVIYQGHHGDRAAHRADVILPGAAYTEKDATYVNIEGRAQLGRLAVYPPGDAREDWKIVRALSQVVGKKLPYDTLEQLRKRLYGINPRFQRIDQIQPVKWQSFGEPGLVQATPFKNPIENYYMTDPISRASATMAHCTEAFVAKPQRTGTHG